MSLPMAIAFGVISGLGPMAGLYASIIGGLVAAVLGGSEYQISGPTPPTALAIASVVAYNPSSAALVILIAGTILVAAGMMKAGRIIKYLPYPLTMGFLTGISLLILKEEGIKALNADPRFAALMMLSLGIAYLIRTIGLKNYAILMSLLVSSAIGLLGGAETIGGISAALPSISIPDLSDFGFAFIQGLTLALIVAMDSLLTCTITDTLTKTEHDSDKELIGQGLGNIVSSLAGGLPVSGSDVPTLANVQAGASSRWSAIFSKIFLLAGVLLFSPILSMIPEAVLSGLLMYIALSIVEWEYIFSLFKIPRTDAIVFMTVLILTVVAGLIPAVISGVLVASLLFLKKISEDPLSEELVSAHFPDRDIKKYDKAIRVYTFNGPLFFGTARVVAGLVKNTDAKAVVLKMYPVTAIDETGAVALKDTIKDMRDAGIRIYLSGVRGNVRQTLDRYGIVEMVGEENIIFNPRKAIEKAISDIE